MENIGTAARGRSLLTRTTAFWALAVLGIAITAIVSGWVPQGELDTPPDHYFSYFVPALLLYLAAAALVFRGPNLGKAGTVIIIGMAIAMRVALLTQMPVLSTDAYRYTWDGRVQLEGINPYRYVPADELLLHLREGDDQVFPYINRADYCTTPYPPAAQRLFMLAGLFGTKTVFNVKILMFVLDLLTLGVVLVLLRRSKLDVNRAVLYAWSPLIIWEAAHSAHVDTAAMCFVMLALLARTSKKDTLVGVALGLATLTKFFPAAVFPAFYRKWDWKMPVAFVATCVIGYLPYLRVGMGVFGSLTVYSEEEGLASGDRYYPLVLLRLLVPIPTSVYLLMAMGLLGGTALYFVLRSRDDDPPPVIAYRAAMLFGLGLLVVTPRWAWYFMTLVPLMALRVFPAWLYATLVCSGLYAVWYIDMFPGGMDRVPMIIYIPVYIMLGIEAYRTIRSARPEVSVASREVTAEA